MYTHAPYPTIDSRICIDVQYGLVARTPMIQIPENIPQVSKKESINLTFQLCVYLS